ncbi:MAG: aminotransferase class I/II-fold pyridoxal phosphate-dependent enzyme [Bdellovibrionales bacterium]|nr:aminotransferase class I/II-fold pyridoxal phosphate-dependent enzyme [Bdellovibrionales bacterium]
MRKIPASGINLFQLIYVLIQEYESAHPGEKALNLSLGNPDLIPPKEVLDLKSRFANRPDYDLHTYAEDKNLNRFAEGMIECFSGLKLESYAHLRATPIAGIKTATAILPLACGLHLKGRENFRVATNLPAYDVMGTWAASYLGSNRIVWPLSAKDGMKMRVDGLRAAVNAAGAKPDLVFVIRPGNPASAGATREEWTALIEYCVTNGIRLVNDGAYATLTDGKSHVPLAAVAKDHPNLEWAELYSMSKSFSDPGQRLGVLVGSKDFVEDFVLIKGNTDSGPVPDGMAAYGELFREPATAKRLLDETYAIYRRRLDVLVPKLKGIGLRPACETTSGFFTLWLTPDEAFGIDLVKEAAARGIPKAELYNRLVIERTGIVGVHFTGPKLADGSSESFIRYAVCTDVTEPGFAKRFDAAIATIKPEYR